LVQITFVQGFHQWLSSPLLAMHQKHLLGLGFDPHGIIDQHRLPGMGG